MKKRQKIFLAFLLMFFVMFGTCGFSRYSSASDTASSIRDDIDKYNKKLEAAQQELATQQSQLYKNQSKITATKTLITGLIADISKKETELNELTNQATANKKMLSEYIRQIYYADQDESVVSLAISDSDLNDFSSNFDGIIGVKAKIIASLETIYNAKDQVEKVKADLADLQKSNAAALAVQQSQQVAIASDVQETQVTIAQLQAKINKLRSMLSSFLGESFTMDDVVAAVKYADSKTGVRKEFLFAVLDKETDLGRFTGGCTYDKSKMGSTNLTYFKGICDDLGYDYKKMKVSCALSYGIGGAMGVAQFMPSTWMGYADSIASKTGNDPADPWSLKDGIMGMALYLKNKGGDSKSGEYQAAAMYYCGSNWKRTVCKNYADTVISWSKGYDSYF